MVWRRFELANTGDSPWTTGPALILQDMLPLGQDLLTYTPRGGTVLLPVTVAVDICAGSRQEEIARQPNALRWNHASYARIDRRATITLENRSREDCVVRIRATVAGRATDVSDDGLIVVDSARGIDNVSTVAWEVVLPAGTSRSVTVDYSQYVH